MSRKSHKQRVKTLHTRVYALHGALSTSWDGKGKTYALVSLPGITTKYELVDDAIKRLDNWEKNRNEAIKSNNG